MSSSVQLPVTIKRSAISLEELGIKGAAWKREEAYAVVQF